MAKIDCSQAVNYIRESKRMCENYRHDCDSCPMSIKNNGYDRLCYVIAEQYPERAVEIVQKWNDAHPVKTRLDDLKEKYPNFMLNPNGYPGVRPFVFGCCSDCKECTRAPSSECWHEPVDGGATGKAVE